MPDGELAMRVFNHIGLPTDQPQPGEVYVPETKVHVTQPNRHPMRVEFLRFEPDSPVTGPLRDGPHIAFVVPRLEPHLEGQPVLLGPFEALPGLHVAFIQRDGVVWEFMHFRPGHQAEGFLPPGWTPPWPVEP